MGVGFASVSSDDWRWEPDKVIKTHYPEECRAGKLGGFADRSLVKCWCSADGSKTIGVMQIDKVCKANSRVSDDTNPTSSDSCIQGALKKLLGLGLVVDIASEMQQCELQVWESLQWIWSEFDCVVQYCITVVHNQQRQITIFRKGIPGALPILSHVILLTKNMQRLHELHFVADQMTFASPAPLTEMIKTCLWTHCNSLQF